MTDKMLIDAISDAMANAVIRDDEGEFPRLFDLLGFSGENKAWTVTDGLAEAALGVIRNRQQATTLSDADLYYLRSILNTLQEMRDATVMDTVNYGWSLGDEALADNTDWLDCFIEKHERQLGEPLSDSLEG